MSSHDSGCHFCHEREVTQCGSVTSGPAPVFPAKSQPSFKGRTPRAGPRSAKPPKLLSTGTETSAAAAHPSTNLRREITCSDKKLSSAFGNQQHPFITLADSS